MRGAYAQSAGPRGCGEAAVQISRAQLSADQPLQIEVEGPPRVLGMSRQIAQVALNLLINAIQASGEHGTFVATVRTLGPEVMFSVRDDGVGMSAAVLERIFLPFFTTKSVNRGTGLGHPVPHGIISAHGGRIAVASEPGKGTFFEVFLPGATLVPPEQRGGTVER